MSRTDPADTKRTIFCFDLDGTVTRTEVLPCIASELGIANEMAALTKATMDGHIEFEPSFRLRCLLLAQIDPARIQQIVANIPLNSDIFNFIKQNKDDCIIITGNLDVWVQPIIEACGCRAFTSHAIYRDNRLHLESVLSKGHALQELREAHSYARIVAVGDGANDAAMLDFACIGIAYGGVHRPASSAILASNYVINDGSTLCRLLNTL